MNDASDLLGARHDLALVKLVTPLLLSSTMQVLEIEKSAWPSRGHRLCTLAGYGQNMDNDTRLHVSVLRVTQGCDCIEDTEIICAKILKDGDDSPCFGDAGSVLVCDNKGVAVTSRGIPTTYCDNPHPENSSHTMVGCARKNTYFLFSNLLPHLQWFQDLVPRDALGYLHSKANRHSMKYVQYYDVITSVHLFALLILFSSHFY
uniref:Granzyme k-like protein n=1 Tax=Triatoma infestans TaxID=30076 RepID=A0A171A085_TRIIF